MKIEHKLFTIGEMAAMKKFLIIGNMNAITYKEIFPYIKNNELWLGVSRQGTGQMYFLVDNDSTEQTGQIVIDGQKYQTIGSSAWFTNLPHNKRYEQLDLYKRYNADEYPKYDNYDAIEVSKVCEIPLDYEGVMGVPITFLGKYCPSQFEIIGGFNGYKECDYDSALLCGTRTEYIDKNGNIKTWTGPTINKTTKYFRILIRRK